MVVDFLEVVVKAAYDMETGSYRTGCGYGWYAIVFDGGDRPRLPSGDGPGVPQRLGPRLPMGGGNKTLFWSSPSGR